MTRVLRNPITALTQLVWKPPPIKLTTGSSSTALRLGLAMLLLRMKPVMNSHKQSLSHKVLTGTCL